MKKLSIKIKRETLLKETSTYLGNIFVFCFGGWGGTDTKRNLKLRDEKIRLAFIPIVLNMTSYIFLEGFGGAGRGKIALLTPCPLNLMYNTDRFHMER